MPKNYLVKARLEELIAELGPGGRLPTEADLAQRHGVARATVRQALRELLLEGRLRRQGRGTVVAGPKIELPRRPVRLHPRPRRAGGRLTGARPYPDRPGVDRPGPTGAPRDPGARPYPDPD
ncbi:GntR family transcriptional regulator [Kitasatospora sp. NPDC001095]